MRRKMTSADRYIDALERACPALREMADGAWVTSGDATVKESLRIMEENGMLDRLMTLGEAELTSVLSGCCDIRLVRPEDVALYSRWRTCRHVFDFDRTLAGALKESELPGSLPLDALRTLPYPIQYIQAPMVTTDIRRRSDGTVEFLDIEHPGFFVWEDSITLPDGGAEEAISFAFAPADSGSNCSPLHVSLCVPTLADAVEDLVDADMALYETSLREGGYSFGEQDAVRAATRRDVADALALLLYVVSDGAEQEVTYRPSPGTRRKNLSKSTIHEVGTRTGAALRAARVRYVGRQDVEPTGRTMATHVRAGHWHNHWHGQVGSAERRLVPHWQPPVVVNPDGRRDVATVVHEARGDDGAITP